MSDSLPSDAQVFAVASGKGGVGKTTTAVNVSAALAESGAETVVVDADLGMANVADSLDVSITGPTLQDVLAGESSIENATYRTQAGLAVVPGSTDLSSYGGADPAGLGEVVAALREEFEYVFLDVGAGLSHDTALPLGLADAVVLVTTPREMAARDTGKTRELADRIDATVGGVVVTRVREEPGELGPDAVSELVGTTVLTAIPDDGAVREALSAGQPIVTHAPASRVTTAYRRLAAALTGREVGQPVAESTESAEPAESSESSEPSDDEDDATSIEELLEREADRSADVSALTGDSSDSDDADGSADDPPTLVLEGDEASGDTEGEDEEEQPDPLADDLDPALDGDDADQESETDETESDIGVETDGDIVIADEAPLDEDSMDDDGDDATDNEDDPMAKIPRFDDEDDAEFTRGSQADDPLASDPLADDPLADDPLADDPLAADPLEAEPADDLDPAEESDTGTDDGIEPSNDTGDGVEQDKDAANDANDDEADGTDETDEVAAGPRVEIDEPDDTQDRPGLLGRLTGLFR